MRRFFLLTLFIFFVAATSRADFYAYSDASGTLHITNRPTSGGYTLLMRETPAREKRTKRGEIDGIIEKTSERYGVDPHLVRAVVEAESDYNTRAVSRAGAAGLMQLMPETARDLGVSNVTDPAENIEGGTRHLRRLLDTFNNDVSLAVAAYNAGEEAVRKYGAVPPFSETRRYVKKVLELYRRYRHGH